MNSSTPVRSMSNSADKWRPLRVWPVAILLPGMVLARYTPSLIDDGPAMMWAVSAFGPMLLSILLLLWWLIASRARGYERVLGVVGLSLAFAASLAGLHPTMRGPAVPVYMIPVGMALFGIGAIVCCRMLSTTRTYCALILAAIGFASATLLRCDGAWGNFAMGLDWRWRATSDEMLAQRQDTQPAADSSLPADSLPDPAWASFRGGVAASRVPGLRLDKDWKSRAPQLKWKTIVGPGWSSFAVAGDWLFTQEQRLNMEAVVAYSAKTGQEIWRQQIESRFDDPLGGPGPRATPTLAAGKIFTMGAQGWVSCLEARSGEIVWQKDVREIAERTPPMWGFSASPLVVGPIVVVYAGGKSDRAVIAFDVETGELAWTAPSGDDSYSSPQLCRIAGEDSIAMLSNKGLALLDPTNGKTRLDYPWATIGYRSLQPQVVDENSMLLPTGMGYGTRLVKIQRVAEEYSATEVWTSRRLKPDFNDMVVYQDHIYGFDASIFTCISLKSGEQKWKGGRYGKGQVLLVEESGLLLILSESGELVLVEADPSGHTELAKFQALEGRTWNHPVLIGDQLFIRNSQQAACYQLPLMD